MLTATMPTAAAHPALRAPAAAPQRIADTLQGLQDHVEISRRILHAGDSLYRTGDNFGCLHVVHSGFFKTLNLAADGREQVVGLHFKGDWLGFDGIATGRYGCDAVALDTGEVWSVRYDALLAACARHAPLLGLLHAAMSREISRDRDSLLSLCTLSADARVADFLRYWAEAMAQCGLRNDQITLRMTRAEIGNYLGMTVETVSRALTKLARGQLIAFTERGRRDICIPDVSALAAYVQRSLAPSPVLQ
ncbi:CRP/FNR family transcriptional regulator [Pelomonas saccharophila]|uniref:CRP/FNR family transcriptional regulator n=1 Tax=Roseateles saccharophilus TaxID=304 RepID=A0ABU1YUW3_ROSSA|nr:Crp/Fnr family transcriptional regulator [Roseateles saccharophilus]MDR7272667.1 CRP/FNR family transcriptional regulator [Roseateles saccharophilus]